MTPDQPTNESSLLEELMDEIPEGLQIISNEWRYLYVNKTVCLQGKKERVELLGKTMMECYPGIDRTPLFEQLKKCVAEQGRIIMETEFIYPNGTKGWFRLSINPWANGVIILSCDITENISKIREISSKLEILKTLIANKEDHQEEIDKTISDLQKYSSPLLPRIIE